jgi:hypothetical protein
MMRWIIAIFAYLILCGFSAPSRAAEISCTKLYDVGEPADFLGFRARDYWASGRRPTPYVTCAIGFLNGQISKGDYKKVVAFLKAHHPFVNAFYLNSPGGEVDEALNIGRMFRKYLISTSAPRIIDLGASVKAGSRVNNYGDIPFLSAGDRDLCRGPNCTCASACALIWFGGVDRSGMVGLHRPRINDPMFRGLSPADASTGYRQVLGRIAAYLDEMEVPKSIIESMTATSSGEIYWVEDIDDGLTTPPSIAEWEAASCGDDVAVGKTVICQFFLRDKHRDRLAPP